MYCVGVVRARAHRVCLFIDTNKVKKTLNVQRFYYKDVFELCYFKLYRRKSRAEQITRCYVYTSVLKRLKLDTFRVIPEL